jgi:hypothetical protein
MARSLAPSRKHLAVARGSELAEGSRPGLIIFLAECHGFGSQHSQLDQICVLEPLKIDVRVHGTTITH